MTNGLRLGAACQAAQSLQELWAESIDGKAITLHQPGKVPTMRRLATLDNIKSGLETAAVVGSLFAGKYVTTASALLSIGRQLISSNQPDKSSSEYAMFIRLIENSLDVVLNNRTRAANLIHTARFKQGNDVFIKADDFFHPFTTISFLSQETATLPMSQVLNVVNADPNIGKPLLMAAISAVVNTGMHALIARQSYEELGKLLVTRLRNYAFAEDHLHKDDKKTKMQQTEKTKPMSGYDRMMGIGPKFFSSFSDAPEEFDPLLVIPHVLSQINDSGAFLYKPYRRSEYSDSTKPERGDVLENPFSSMALPSDPASYVMASYESKEFQKQGLPHFIWNEIQDWSDYLSDTYMSQGNVKRSIIGNDFVGQMRSQFH